MFDKNVVFILIKQKMCQSCLSNYLLNRGFFILFSMQLVSIEDYLKVVLER